MVTKRFCDRCNKEMGLEMSSNDNELHFTKKRNTRYGYDKLIHLCNNCMINFDKFMDGEKK